MKRFGLFANTTKPEAIESAEKTARLLHSIHVECCVEPVVAERFAPDLKKSVQVLELEQFDKFADIIVSFGGDGTMLTAARVFLDSDIPIMGVNLGNLGFLAEFTVHEVDDALSAIMTGEYIVENRSLMEARVGDQVHYALNDMVLHKSDVGRMITIRASIDSELIAEYRADALIVSTPTGSTAYSLSSGGPIIAPTCSVLCMTPVSPHSLTLRPLVVPDSAEITLQEVSGTAGCHLISDGQIIATFDNQEQIGIQRSEKVIKLLKRTNRTYYDLLKMKLLWSARATDTNQNTNP